MVGYFGPLIKRFEQNEAVLDFISKPIDFDKLEAKINRIIRERELIRQLELQSVSDDLTGLYNRRFFYEFLEKEWLRSVRSHKPISIIFSDVDYFKLYNDYYGHQVGDECLEKLGKIFKYSIKRAMDIVARVGGEEFIVILPETDKEGAVCVAKSIQERLLAARIPHHKSSISTYVTLSMGIATIVPKNETQFENLVKLADDNLYKAKELGRNTIV